MFSVYRNVDPVIWFRDALEKPSNVDFVNRVPYVGSSPVPLLEVHFDKPLCIEFVGDDERAQAYFRHGAKMYWLGDASPEIKTRGVYGWLAFMFPGVTFFGPLTDEQATRGNAPCLVDASGYYVSHGNTLIPSVDDTPIQTTNEPVTYAQQVTPNADGTFTVVVGGQRITVAADVKPAKDDNDDDTPF